MVKQLDGQKFQGQKFQGLKFYGLKNCDSCRAALKALDMAGMQVEFQDVRDDGVPADVLRLALEEHGADRVINRRSTTWRGLDQAARDGDLHMYAASHRSELATWLFVLLLVVPRRPLI